MIDALAVLAVPIVVALIAVTPGMMSARRLRRENAQQHDAGLAVMTTVLERTCANAEALGEIREWTVSHDEHHRRVEGEG